MAKTRHSFLHGVPRPVHALPARFRRTRCLIVGCGDVGLRLARQMVVRGHVVRALTRQTDKATLAAWRAQGITPVAADLDRPASLRRLRALGTRVLHLAPPRSTWDSMAAVSPDRQRQDERTRQLVRALARPGKGVGVRALVYVSTSGVYGDCQGEWVDESRPVAPQTDRARRRVDAERQLRGWATRRARDGHAAMPQVSILRAPGIYAPDRPQGTPRERLERGTPILHAQDDIHTNHIHADDLARACWWACWKAPAQRIYHAVDHSDLRMGDYLEQAARHYGLPAPRRIRWEEARQRLSPLTLSFWAESRRLSNRRLTQELKFPLRYPTVAQGWGWTRP